MATPPPPGTPGSRRGPTARRKWPGRLVLVVLAGALLSGGWIVLVREKPVPVTVRAVERGRVEETVTNSKAGTVRTRRRAQLSPDIGGRVMEITAREGDRVKAGQVLIRLSAGEQEAQLESSRRALDTARATERQACLGAAQSQRDLERTRKLASEQILSQDRLEQARMRAEADASGCAAARSAIRQAASGVDMGLATLARTSIVAPFDGVVADLHAEVGEFVAPSTPGVLLPAAVDLIDTDALYVSAPLDEVDVAKVSVGQPVRVTIDAYPGKGFPGHVSRVAPYVEDAREQSRTFDVEVELGPVAEGIRLLPGTTADVLRVPSYALLEGDKVLLVRSDRLVAVPVVIGLRNWEYAQVVSGVSEGDRVVVSLDRAEVKAGARVRVAEAGAT